MVRKMNPNHRIDSWPKSSY